MRIVTGWLALVLICAACASRHALPPKSEFRAEVEAMREVVATKVRDEQRVARLNEAIDGFDAEAVSFSKALTVFRANLEALNSRPDATRDQFDSLIEAFDRERVATRARLIELHRQMIGATTAAEWKDLAQHERKMLSVTPGV